ncbi:hypothetical protein F2Q68_00016962 [Brassica cretica]|uniref:Uncharacterized protein n=1 Tax=Brassica cretica TaxID=69181 RepID=A0A8S9HYX2_BRACR|nr:hypothetical protein F2Q68_00016962 [Brassica cretica]
MGAVEKMITKKGSSSDDLQLTTTSNPPKPVHEPGSESVNEAKSGQNEAKEHSVTTEPSSSTELCLVKPADDLPSDEPSVLILDKQINVNNFVQKDLDEMFLQWDGDVEDPAADNIIKVMFNDLG